MELQMLAAAADGCLKWAESTRSAQKELVQTALELLLGLCSGAQPL